MNKMSFSESKILEPQQLNPFDPKFTIRLQDNQLQVQPFLKNHKSTRVAVLGPPLCGKSFLISKLISPKKSSLVSKKRLDLSVYEEQDVWLVEGQKLLDFPIIPKKTVKDLLKYFTVQQHKRLSMLQALLSMSTRVVLVGYQQIDMGLLETSSQFVDDVVIIHNLIFKDKLDQNLELQFKRLYPQKQQFKEYFITRYKHLTLVHFILYNSDPPKSTLQSMRRVILRHSFAPLSSFQDLFKFIQFNKDQFLLPQNVEEPFQVYSQEGVLFCKRLIPGNWQFEVQVQKDRVVIRGKESSEWQLFGVDSECQTQKSELLYIFKRGLNWLQQITFKHNDQGYLILKLT